MPDSPKKKCTKRKAADINLKAAKPKRTQAQHSVPPPSVMASTVDESQQTRQSGCLAWTSQPKGSNSLDSTIPANPAAPEQPCKGCGSYSKKKQPPPPYNISVQPIPNTMTINTPIPNAPIPDTTIPRAQPKTKTVAPPLSIKSGSNNFCQWSR
ncbi:hypothetical protein DEU56DRAFT_912034 [Suillus clintonianus]|uniref:uncharacterized protein n=1 Tax=Suillus clintonianus TaxID=1904413 RepID=UPI001B85DD3D|nr:uncharacterized protein DEU56DRAFT_912034 [Suillus clintonianus]KAG2139770.1 hypothetical protein DEU56DRAFT_912034 [Suillus clintonianus]